MLFVFSEKLAYTLGAWTAWQQWHRIVVYFNNAQVVMCQIKVINKKITNQETGSWLLLRLAFKHVVL